MTVNTKLLNERDRARYYRLMAITPKNRTDADHEEIADLLNKIERQAARDSGRATKKFTREV